MFDNLKTLTIEGKSVAKLSLNGRLVWESSSNNVSRNALLTADDKLFMTTDGKYFVVKAEDNI